MSDNGSAGSEYIFKSNLASTNGSGLTIVTEPMLLELRIVEVATNAVGAMGIFMICMRRTPSCGETCGYMSVKTSASNGTLPLILDSVFLEVCEFTIYD